MKKTRLSRTRSVVTILLLVQASFGLGAARRHPKDTELYSERLFQNPRNPEALAEIVEAIAETGANLEETIELLRERFPDETVSLDKLRTFLPKVLRSKTFPLDWGSGVVMSYFRLSSDEMALVIAFMNSDALSSQEEKLISQMKRTLIWRNVADDGMGDFFDNCAYHVESAAGTTDRAAVFLK